MHTHANAMSATHTDIRLFWCNVRDQSLSDMQLFLKRFPDTVALWRDAAHLHQFGQVVYANAGMNLLGTDFSTACPPKRAPVSAAVLFMIGCDFEMCDMPYILEAMYGECAVALAPVSYERLLKRGDVWMRKHVDRCELAMVACARTRNLAAFRQALDACGGARRGPGTVFDDTPQRLPGITVLQAALMWEDAKIRRELLAFLLPKCTLAYMLLAAPVTGTAELGFASACICTIQQAHTAFEEAVAVPDADALQMLLHELTKYGVLHEPRCQDMLTRALLFCGNMLTYVHSGVLDDVIIKLCSHLRVEGVAQCHSALASTLENAVARTLARFADNKSHPLYAQAEAAHGIITRALALCASMIKHATDTAERDVVVMTRRTLEEGERFNAAFQQQLHVLDTAHALHDEVHVLRMKTQLLTELLTKQARVLHYVQEHARAAGVHAAPELSDAKFVEFLSAMDALEAELLSASMPVIEGVAALPPAVPTPGASLEQRFQSIRGAETANLQALQTRLRAIREPVGMLI